MFDFIKKIFSKGTQTTTEPASSPVSNPEPIETEFLTKPCRTCGRPITYNPKWKHIPNYCRDCKAEYRKDTITRTCKSCGKTFTLPSSVQHWPNYCQECRAKFRSTETVTRTCKGCGRRFTFPSSVQHWPRYCRECQANRKRAPR